MIPGPVPVVPRILRAMSKPMINHRGKEFSDLYDDCRSILAELFQTKNEIFVLSGSGSCAMEAAVGNLIEREDKIITIVNGKFGERFKELGDRYGKVISVEFEWGTSIDLEKVKEALEEGAKAIAFVHNETSTGILNPAEEIGKLAKKYDALFIMDAITSTGGTEVKVDKWGVDIAVVGSQKCLGMPPGLSAVSVSERAWEFMHDKAPYYMDLKAYKKSADKDLTQTPYTPALPLFFALQEALHIVKEEGLENRINRHKKGAEAVRAAADALNIERFPQLNEFSKYSNTVTAMKIPYPITDKQLKSGMLDRGILISGGQSHLSGKIFRIGTMGNFTPRDILTTIQTLEVVLQEHNIISDLGAGVEAANKVLNQ